MSWKLEESTYNVLLMEQKLNYQLLIVNLEPTMGSLNPQGDKLESTRKKFKKNSAISLIITYEKNFYKLRSLFKGCIKLDRQENIF